MSSISKAVILGMCAVNSAAAEDAACPDAPTEFKECVATGLPADITLKKLALKIVEKEKKHVFEGQLEFEGKLKDDRKPEDKLYRAKDGEQPPQGGEVDLTYLNDQAKASKFAAGSESKSAQCPEGNVTLDITAFKAKGSESEGKAANVKIVCEKSGGNCWIYCVIAGAVVVIGGVAAYFVLANKGGDAGDEEEDDEGEGEDE